MRPHALLINPWIHDFSAYDFWQKPLGLLGIAADLRSMGYALSFIDCLDIYYPGRTTAIPKRNSNGSGKFDWEEIKKPDSLSIIPRKFKRYGVPSHTLVEMLDKIPRPDVVLMTSVMTYWYTGVSETIGYVRRAFKDIPIVLGGVYASLLPEHAKRVAGADFISEGDFRVSLSPVFENLALPSVFPEKSIMPAWDLYGRLDSAAIITGRGCSHRCAYCAVHSLWPRLVRREPFEVIDEIKRLEREHGVSDIVFLDDSLIDRGGDHFMAILNGIISNEIRARFHVFNALHLRGITRELAFMMKRGRVETLRFGLETIDDNRYDNNKADVDDLMRTVSYLKEAKYRGSDIGVYLMVGLPGQRAASIKKSIIEVIKAGARPYLNEYSPVPKSPLWDHAKSVARYDIESEPLFQNNTLLACAHPELDVDTITTLKKSAKETVF